jgi:hypothetical protein
MVMANDNQNEQPPDGMKIVEVRTYMDNQNRRITMHVPRIGGGEPMYIGECRFGHRSFPNGQMAPVSFLIPEAGSIEAAFKKFDFIMKIAYQEFCENVERPRIVGPGM